MIKCIFAIILTLIFPLSEYSLGQNISLISSFDTPGKARDVVTRLTAVDAGVSDILDIPYPFVEGRDYSLKSEVNNFGSTQQSIYFVYEVYLTGSASPEISDTLYLPDMPAGSTDTLLFPTTFVPLPETTYTLISYSILAGDEDPSNDTTEIQVESIYYYNVFYGDPYGAPLEANIGSIVEMTVWGSAPVNIDLDDDGIVDSINFMINTVASPDSIIISRYPSRDPQDTLPARSYFPFYPLSDWDDVEVFPEMNNSPEPGLSTQAMWGTTNIIDPQDDPLFNTVGDTIPLLVFAMRTAMDTSLMGQLVFPFQRGFYTGYGTGLLWGFQDAVTQVYPDDHYCGLRFYSESELGYIVGNVSDLNSNPFGDVGVSIEGAFREDSTDSGGNFALSWITPGTYEVAFSHPNIGDTVIADVSVTAGDTTVVNLEASYYCAYVAGDVNGSGHADGLDIVYLVYYLKGGEYPPDSCYCPGHGDLFVAADANSSCSVNGLDVTYLVAYFKGGSPILYCADCPPAG